jgi:hypothetical protein
MPTSFPSQYLHCAGVIFPSHLQSTFWAEALYKVNKLVDIQ